MAATRRGTLAANDTLRLVTARYREGIDPFLNTLDAQRSAYAAERNLVAVRLLQAPANLAGAGTPAEVLEFRAVRRGAELARRHARRVG